MSPTTRRIATAFLAVATLVGLMLVAAIASAQTQHEVSAGGTPPQFDPPAFLPPIEVGDSVHWLASDGTHNVASDPGQDDSFRSGKPTADLDFTWQFNVAGEFTYQCEVHGGQGMVGVITVVGPTQTESPTPTPTPTPTPSPTPTPTPSPTPTPTPTPSPSPSPSPTPSPSESKTPDPRLSARPPDRGGSGGTETPSASPTPVPTVTAIDVADGGRAGVVPNGGSGLLLVFVFGILALLGGTAYAVYRTSREP